MSELAAEQMTRLIKILGLLASDRDGERAAAAWQASRIIKSAGLTWEEVLARPSLPPPHLNRAASDPQRPDAVWFDDARLAQRHVAELTPWERQFIAKIAFLITLSRKQTVILAGIAAALRARGLR